jgi:hypothetical protein
MSPCLYWRQLFNDTRAYFLGVAIRHMQSFLRHFGRNTNPSSQPQNESVSAIRRSRDDVQRQNLCRWEELGILATYGRYDIIVPLACGSPLGSGPQPVSGNLSPGP